MCLALPRRRILGLHYQQNPGRKQAGLGRLGSAFQPLEKARRSDSLLDVSFRNFDHPAMNWLRETTEGVVLNVRVVPRAPRSVVQGLLGDALKIRLAAPPVEGKANTELVRYLAEELDLHVSRVQLLSGATGRNKRVLIQGMGGAAIAAKLMPH